MSDVRVWTRADDPLPEMASKLSTQRARAHGLHSELDREKAHRVQEEVNAAVL